MFLKYGRFKNKLIKNIIIRKWNKYGKEYVHIKNLSILENDRTLRTRNKFSSWAIW